MNALFSKKLSVKISLFGINLELKIYLNTSLSFSIILIDFFSLLFINSKRLTFSKMIVPRHLYLFFIELWVTFKKHATYICELQFSPICF